jgi:hypothetical protein
MAYRDGLGAERSVTRMTSPEIGTGKGVSAILNRLGKALIMTAATASVITFAASPALAAGTWTVKPGGAITAKAGTTTVTDKTAGQSVTCASSSSAGTLKKGTGLSGTGIGTVTSITFTNCSVLGMSITVTLTGSMSFNALSYDSTTKIATVSISGIHGALSASGCSATIDGTSATAHNGKVKGKFHNVGSKLKILAGGGNLHLYNVNCFGVINNNDSVNFTTTYKVSPAQTITSP